MGLVYENAFRFGSPLLWYFVRAFAILLYFFPSIAATRYQHPKQAAILHLNIFLGWTIVGWVVALRWALQGCGGSRPVERS
jgi:hypothetical protein